MTRQYSPRGFLRQAPKQLLKQFFAQRGLLTDFLWYMCRETEIEPIYAAWQLLPAAQREEVESSFRAIFDVACEAGITAFVAEASFAGLSLAEHIDQLENYIAKALWAYLNHRDLFEVASLFTSVGSLPKRYWTRFTEVPRREPLTSPEACRALADALARFYRERQGRGQRCTVETYLRQGRQHYYFAYPDDYADTYIGAHQ